MKLSYYPIHNVFDTEIYGVNTIVIENRKLFCDFVHELFFQAAGLDGQIVVSKDDKIVTFSKYAEVFSSFIPFQMNEKRFIPKIINEIDKRSAEKSFFEKTGKILSDLENHLDDLTFVFKCDFNYNSLSFLSLIKAAGISLKNDCDLISEKFLNFMETVLEFEGEKLFITVNMRSYVEDSEMEAFIKTVTSHRYDLIMLENISYPKLENEIRYTIDSDLCEF